MSKKYKSGLVLGKYAPLHLGHCHLISSAAIGCEKLVVLACSLKSEPIPGQLRYQWVKHFCDTINKNNYGCVVKVENIIEELPQLPEEHPNFWQIWCDLIRKNCPDIEVVYSSEDYGFELAKRLNIKHELVDKERIKFSVSGTKIRENPYENWEFIYPEARQYFIRRMYFLGPESTGKSTISKLLSEKFETNWVPEYGRILWEKNDGNINFMDFCEIVIKQREIEDGLAQRSQSKMMFCDTDIITTKIFCELYYPNDAHELNMFFQYHIKKEIVNNNCHFFLMHPKGVEAVQDGTRSYLSVKQRMMHFKKLKDELDYWMVPYTILTGNYANRISMVEKYIENLSTVQTLKSVAQKLRGKELFPEKMEYAKKFFANLQDEKR